MRILSLLLLAAPAFCQKQEADPNFVPRVTHPSYTTRHPKVLFDEAHLNFHTAGGRYKPFADLIAADGYGITRNRDKFREQSLAGFDVLVSANARGAEGPAAFDQPAFTEEECAAVRDWVKRGAALLLIADHAPFGTAAASLASQFGVDMSKGYTSDPVQHDPESGNHGFLFFSRENGLLGRHPITEGIHRVISFTGQSLKGPEGSTAFLRLADTAVDLTAMTGAAIQAAIAEQRKKQASGAIQLKLDPQAKVSAAGRAQGLALRYGKGRVVVLGEAAMLSAQVVEMPGKPLQRVGMNRPNIDNQQLALNIMHWLSGLLD
jgi:hypothetical protein